MIVDLPGAGVAGEEDELALADPEGDVLQGQRAVRDRTCRRGRGGSRGERGRGRVRTLAPSALRCQVRDDVVGVLDAAAEPEEPSGMPSAARSSGPIPLCDVSRGSETSVSTPARLGAWVTSLSRLSSRSAALAPPASSRPTMPAVAVEHRLGALVIGVRGEARVVHLRDGRMASRPTRPPPCRWRCAGPCGSRASACPDRPARRRADRWPDPRAA